MYGPSSNVHRFGSSDPSVAPRSFAAASIRAISSGALVGRRVPRAATMASWAAVNGPMPRRRPGRGHRHGLWAAGRRSGAAPGAGDSRPSRRLRGACASSRVLPGPRKLRLRTGESGRGIWRSSGAMVRVRGGIPTCSFGSARWSAGLSLRSGAALDLRPAPRP